MANYKDLNDYEIMYLVEEQDENARNLLFNKYQPLILKVASQYKKQAELLGLEIEDLMQEGYLGLYNAIRTYSTKHNVLFYTYAMVSIRSKIINCIRLKNSIKNKTLNQGISLSNPLPETDNETLIDKIENKNAVLPHLIVEEKEMENKIYKFMYSLNFPYSLILELKINGLKTNDIALLLDLSSRYVTNSLFQIRKKLKSFLKDSYS